MPWYMITSGLYRSDRTTPVWALSCPPSVFQRPGWEPDQCPDPPASTSKVSDASSCCVIIDLVFKVLNLLLTHTSRVLLFHLALSVGWHYCLWWTLGLPLQWTLVFWVLDSALSFGILFCLPSEACRGPSCSLKTPGSPVLASHYCF